MQNFAIKHANTHVHAQNVVATSACLTSITSFLSFSFSASLHCFFFCNSSPLSCIPRLAIYTHNYKSPTLSTAGCWNASERNTSTIYLFYLMALVMRDRFRRLASIPLRSLHCLCLQSWNFQFISKYKYKYTFLKRSTTLILAFFDIYIYISNYCCCIFGGIKYALFQNLRLA